MSKGMNNAMNCPNCGGEVSENDYWCPFCGIKISDDISESLKNNIPADKRLNMNEEPIDNIGNYPHQERKRKVKVGLIVKIIFFAVLIACAVTFFVIRTQKDERIKVLANELQSAVKVDENGIYSCDGVKSADLSELRDLSDMFIASSPAKKTAVDTVEKIDQIRAVEKVKSQYLTSEFKDTQKLISKVSDTTLTEKDTKFQEIKDYVAYEVKHGNVKVIYIDTTGHTIAEAAERMGKSLKDFLAEYNLPADMPGTVSESEAYYTVPVGTVAMKFGKSFAQLKADLKFSDSFSQNSPWGEVRDSLLLGNYVTEQGMPEFRAKYGFGNDVTVNSKWKDVRDKIDTFDKEENEKNGNTKYIFNS